MALKVVPTPVRTRLTELADEWLEDVRTNRSLRTVASYEWPVRRLAIPFMESAGITDPAQLDQAALNRLTNSLAEKGLAKASVASYLRQINVWLRWCGEREGRDKVAVAKWQRPDRLEREVLTKDELRALEDAATTARDVVIVRVLTETGMRLGELLALSVEDVQKGPAGPFLRVMGSKTRQERLVPLRPPLHRALSDYIEKKRPKDSRTRNLFVTLRRGRRSGEYEPLGKRTVETMVKGLAVAAGIKPERVHPHAFRHSLATRGMQEGMNPALLAAMLGHSPAVLMATYSHVRALDARDELNRLLAD